MDLKWLQSDKAKRISREARAKARAVFKSEYPDGDFSKIEVKVTFDEKKTRTTAEIMYKAGPDYWKSISHSDEQYWSDDFKLALVVGGFPNRLTMNKSLRFPVPVVSFDEKVWFDMGNLFNQELNVFVTPNDSFKIKFRDIFSDTKITHVSNSGTELKKWLAALDMRYWPQQLNFAFWCATTGCGLSRATVNSVSDQIKSLLLFHNYLFHH